MSEFKSKLEEILPAEELLFDPTPGFGPYRNVMPEEAVAHPAKANTRLLEFLISKFTKPGDTVLDPMAGSGSTGVVAALHGRNAVQVELEEKFYKWMEKARENVEKHPTLTPKGKIVNIQGDARKLSKILKDADVIVTSPPYAKSDMRKSKLFLKMREQPGSNWYNRSLNGNAVKYYLSDGYETRDNIGNLPHGDIDAVITSPPFGPAQRGGGIFKKGYMRVENGKIISDPNLPFRHGRPVNPNNPKNIDNLPYVDTVITSPPYDNAVHCRGHSEYQERLTKEKSLFMDEYGASKANIGNLKKETYLEAMLKVYGEMWKVLKPDGLAIIVVKPFIRNKKVVDLPYHTWLLLKKVGFKLVKLYKLRLKQQSFWRILYYRRFPSVPKIRHEYIIIVKKSLVRYHR